MSLNRRAALKLLGWSGAMTITPAFSFANSKANKFQPFRFCLNTSTISGQQLSLIEYINITAEAGYDGIELWVRDVKQYLENGHSAPELKRYIESKNLVVENAIGFAPWMVSNEGLLQMKADMLLMKSIGCKRIAAPAAGVKSDEVLDLMQIGQKYHQILEYGRETGVQPLLEFWGAFAPFHNLGQVLMVAAAADHPDTKILADVFHLFRGDSGFNALQLLNGSVVEVFHMNDYPANPPQEQLTDSHRIFPGDGVAPWNKILPVLKKMGGEKILSLELFNADYWSQDPLIVARTGLEKMKKLVQTFGG